MNSNEVYRIIFRFEMAKHISLFMKGVAVDMLIGGFSIRSFAKKFGVSPASVIMWRTLYHDKGISKIVRWIVSGKCETVKNVKKELDNDNETKVLYATVTRTLKRNDLIAVTKKKKPNLEENHINVRLEFANEHKSWTVDDWKK
ncbi:hypothetical protein RFI_35541, partial [Reticulomyxa filosa]